MEEDGDFVIIYPGLCGALVEIYCLTDSSLNPEYAGIRVFCHS